MAGWRARSGLLLALGAAGPAEAHSFGQLYNLPVPLWLYLYGAAAALGLSFLLVAWFASGGIAPASATPLREPRWLQGLRDPRLIGALRGLALLLLALTVLTGLFGSPNPYRNFSMTFFWIVFVLGFTYLTALVGDLYAEINPWRTLAEAVERRWPGATRGRRAYPVSWGHWPALLLYMGFIGLELFARSGPFSLAVMICAYAVLTTLGIAVFGREAWLRQGEFFGVFLALVARMAPLDWSGPRVRLRAPFSGLLGLPLRDLGLVLFILFMLSSTAFDGLSATVWWYALFQQGPFGALMMWSAQHLSLSHGGGRALYVALQSLLLVASPLLYLAALAGCVWLARRITGRRHSTRELLLRFAPTLLPIALVYHVTHYYTLILTQGTQILNLWIDPFGRGWLLPGQQGPLVGLVVPDMAVVWHVQVGLILFGHIVSVWLSHVEALRLFGRREATLSQLPMLALMMLFTVAGLWILAQPLQGGF